MDVGRELPRLARLGELSCNLLPFRNRPIVRRLQGGLGIPQQAGQGRAGARGDDLHVKGQVFRPGVVDRGRQVQTRPRPRSGSGSAWSCSRPGGRGTPGVPFSRIASTRPGKPAPAPRSAQVLAPGAERKQLGAVQAWRDQKSASVLAPTRFICSLHSASSVAKPFGVGQPRAVRRRSRTRSLAKTASGGAAASDMGQQGGERAGRHALDARGLAEGRAGARPSAFRAPRWRDRRGRRSRGPAGRRRSSSRRNAATSAAWRSR